MSSAVVYSSLIFFTDYLPEDFSIILTVKPSSNRATLFTLHGEGDAQLTVNVGKKPIFYYAGSNGNPGKDSPRFTDFNLNDGE